MMINTLTRKYFLKEKGFRNTNKFKPAILFMRLLQVWNLLVQAVS